MTACAVCDQPIGKDDPRKMLSGLPAHRYCDTARPRGICQDAQCQWWMTDHAGECS